jgi:hypothetical protein
VSDAERDSDRDAGYERSDANARPLFLSGFVLALVIGAALAASAWITQASVDAVVEADASAEPPSALRGLRRPAEGAELEAVPARELAKHRAWEDAMLRDTSWIDPVNKVVRIPIERALELTLHDGFPVRTQPAGGNK